MGDHRFTLKAEFSIYGETFRTADWWLNWSADPGDIDGRITNWFLECYSRARAKRDEEEYAAQKEQRERDKEREERATLKRLQQKYGVKP